MGVHLKTINWDTACFYSTFQARNLLVCSTTMYNIGMCNLKSPFTVFITTHRTVYPYSMSDYCSKYLNYWGFWNVLCNDLYFHIGLKQHTVYFSNAPNCTQRKIYDLQSLWWCPVFKQYIIPNSDSSIHVLYTNANTTFGYRTDVNDPYTDQDSTVDDVFIAPWHQWSW